MVDTLSDELSEWVEQIDRYLEQQAYDGKRLLIIKVRNEMAELSHELEEAPTGALFLDV